MCQRLNTGESNNFYFGIFICIGPLIEHIYAINSLMRVNMGDIIFSSRLTPCRVSVLYSVHHSY